MASFSQIVEHVYMYIDLCVELRLYGLSPAHTGMSVGVISVQHLFRQSCWWDFVGIASDSSRRYNLTGNSLILQLLTVFLPQRIYSLQYQNTVFTVSRLDLFLLLLLLLLHLYAIHCNYSFRVEAWPGSFNRPDEAIHVSAAHILPSWLQTVGCHSSDCAPCPGQPSSLALRSCSFTLCPVPGSPLPRRPLLFLWVLVWLAPLCSVPSHSQCRFLRAAFPFPGHPVSPQPLLQPRTQFWLCSLTSLVSLAQASSSGRVQVSRSRSLQLLSHGGLFEDGSQSVCLLSN